MVLQAGPSMGQPLGLRALEASVASQEVLEELLPLGALEASLEEQEEPLPLEALEASLEEQGGPQPLVAWAAYRVAQEVLRAWEA